MGLGRGDDAADAAEHLVRLDPNDPRARLLRDRVLQALGRNRE